MTELVRGGKGTISLHGCSAVKPYYYKRKFCAATKKFKKSML
jgi:hypothetical protein